VIINMTKNCEKSSELQFVATLEKSRFLLLRANRVDMREKEWKIFKPSAPNSGRGSLLEVPIVRL